LQFLTNQPAEAESTEADVRAILAVMSPRKKQGTRRINPVVVGDSASAAEASVAELMRRLETGGGDVPDELRGARVLRLHLSHARVRLMARADVDAWAADLRRTVAKVIYVGDMRWAVDDDQATTPRYYSAVDRMAAALAQLLGELRASGSGHAWLVAASSYQTYVRCQRRALMTTWALQQVSVPAGRASLGLGLALGPRAAR
jgi:glutathione S-transferase